MNKPDDVSAEAWEAVQDAIMIACNNHHAWGALATMTNEWRDDLAVLNARAIDAAILRERERCASLANKQGLWYIDASDMALPVEPSPIIAKDRAKVAFSIRDAIRNPQSLKER